MARIRRQYDIRSNALDKQSEKEKRSKIYTSEIIEEILKDNLDTCVRIPMSSNVRCLNVSNSVAIAVYEVLRQQNFKDLSFTEIQKGEDYLLK